MFTIQCLDKEGEVVHEDEYETIFKLRVYLEGELITKLAHKEIITFLVEQKEN